MAVARSNGGPTRQDTANRLDHLLISMDEFISSRDKSKFEWHMLDDFVSRGDNAKLDSKPVPRPPHKDLPQHRIFRSFNDPLGDWTPFIKEAKYRLGPNSNSKVRVYKVLPPKELIIKYERPLALKVLRCESEHYQWIKTAIKEVKNMKDVEHRHIVSYIASFEYLLLDYAQYPTSGNYEVIVNESVLGIAMYPPGRYDLANYLEGISKAVAQRKNIEGRPMEPNLAEAICRLFRFFGCIAQAITYLQEETPIRIKHKDIKPANVIIDHYYQPILTDFGISARYEEGQQTISDEWTLKTPQYACPQALAGTQRNFRTDVFSLGCVFLEMITLILGSTLEDLRKHRGALEELKFREYGKTIKENKSWITCLEETLAHGRSHLPHLCNDDAYTNVINTLPIINKMLDEGLESRPRASDLWPHFGKLGLYSDLGRKCHYCTQQYEDRNHALAVKKSLPPSPQVSQHSGEANGELNVTSANEEAYREFRSVEVVMSSSPARAKPSLRSAAEEVAKRQRIVNVFRRALG
jgi:serine/threonine protein kinase